MIYLHFKLTSHLISGLQDVSTLKDLNTTRDNLRLLITSPVMVDRQAGDTLFPSKDLRGPWLWTLTR